MKTIEVKFQIIGPIKRSTFDHKNADLESEAIEDLFHWLWSTRLQITRFRHSLVSEFDYLCKGSSLKARRRFSATSYDEHILLVAAANLDRSLKKAQKFVPRKLKLPEQHQRALYLLRNIYEHWDQLRKEYRQPKGPLQGSALRLKQEFPNAVPWSISFDPNTGEITIANTVPLKPFNDALRQLEAKLLHFQRQYRKKST